MTFFNIKNSLVFFSLSLFILSVWACRPKPLEIELPPVEPQVVVFSQIIPNQFMTVLLTKTISALNFSESEGDSLSQSLVNTLLETDATVTVHYRNTIDTLFELTNAEGGTGVYASIQTPQYTNEEYELRVETKDGETLTAKSLMLPLVQFDEITPIIERSSEDSLVTINYKITDLPEDNWYMLNFYTNGTSEPTGIDLNSFFNSGSNLLKKTELLNDITFSSSVFEGTVELPNVNPTDSLVVTISNINEPYYRFLESRENSTNFFTELTKEPITVPTNVEGGLGFFNTHFPDVRVYDLNEW